MAVAGSVSSAALATGQQLAHHDLKVGSKSFALAGALLPARIREDAAVCYSFCRFVDDAVDEVPPDQAAAAVICLRELVGALYDGQLQTDPRLQAFAELIARTRMPREYPMALIDGMAMDAQGQRYQTLSDLMLYCHRVAGVVGLMMCHVLGVRDNSERDKGARNTALGQAAQLGMAMQLTNICRDVVEDWQRGRLYLPEAMTGFAPPETPGSPLPPGVGPGLQAAVKTLLEQAEVYYRSGQKGLRHLSWRAAFSIRVAAWVYRDIGRSIARRRFDVTQGRVVLSRRRKLVLAAAALIRSSADLPARWLRRRTPLVVPNHVARYPDDILCVD